MTDQPTPSGEAFPAATRDDWMRLVEGVLKGRDFEETLVSHTADGIRIDPLYAAALAQAQPVRAEHAPWRVAQRIDHPAPADAAAQALTDLEGGADALTLVFDGARAARGFGLRIDGLDDLDTALDGVLLDLVNIRLDAGRSGRHAAAALIALAGRRGLSLDALDADLGLDPIGAAACDGGFSAAWEMIAERCGETAGALSQKGFAGTVFLADGRPYHEAGGSEAQELGAVLATALAYWRAQEAAGIAPDQGRGNLAFLLAADADQFTTIAKFRALRRLWARIEAAAGLDPAPIRLHAETAWRMTTQRDPWVNMLRATIATFSAGIGGADCVAVTPFTAALGLPDAFARRVARNTQHILLQESNLWRVSDPAAGAGGFEAMTEALCETAWEVFQQIESEGGIVASLASSALQVRIGEVRAARATAIADRSAPITGVSAYPDLDEKPVDVALREPPPEAPEPEAAAMPAGFADLVAAIDAGGPAHAPANPPPGVEPTLLSALPHRREAEPYEHLRDRSDQHLADHGERPTLFLANLGKLAQFNTRAGFARNAFAAGGIAAIGEEGFTDAEALAKAFAESGASAACLCSSDALYAEHGVEAARALKEAGCAILFLAGHPDDLEAPMREAGVDAFLHQGCDLLSLLGEAWAVIAGERSEAF
ncbi:MAG: methylmalonyl-CoA mutase small subunit [Salinarimonas sp.]|nr:methylmalonyl-CoA mutase small subunit [Salinarimonas sp.]